MAAGGAGAAAAAGEPVAADRQPPDGSRCFVCLEAGGRLLQPCACRGAAGAVHEGCLQQLFVSYLQAQATVHRAIEGRCATCRQRYSPAAQASIYRAIVGALPQARLPPQGRLAFRLQLGEVLARDTVAADAEAQALLRAVIADRGANEMHRARAQKALAKTLLREGRADEAEAMLLDCLYVFLSAEAASASGSDCRWAGGTRLNLASVLRARGEPELAAEQLQIVASRYRQERGDGDQDTANAVAALGRCLVELGRGEEVREVVSAVAKASAQILGADHHEEVGQLQEVLRACGGGGGGAAAAAADGSAAL